MAHVIVFGNEKGGCGKSTVAMHLLAWLGQAGQRVAALDLDVRQHSLLRYVENRKQFEEKRNIRMVIPKVNELQPSTNPNREAAEKEDRAAVGNAIQMLARECDMIVIDCPGAHTNFSIAAHDAADTLITPINDSFVDFDMLARIDGSTGEILGPAIYSRAVWDARKERAAHGRPPIDWVVMRNRISTTDAHNKRRIEQSVARLSERIGFRAVTGLSERVVFRELFPQGLTLLDLNKSSSAARFSMSHVSARQELRGLIRNLNLDLDQDQAESAA